MLNFALGFIGLANINVSGGTIVGRGYAWIGIIVSCVLIIASIIVPVMIKVRNTNITSRCYGNLARLGKTMLVYANDYEDRLPKAGAGTNRWTDSLGGHGNSIAWRTDGRQEAYGIKQSSGTTGAVTSSASLFLLVKYMDMLPESFVCAGERKTRAFDLSKWLPSGTDKDLIDVWDFGYYASSKKNQSRHVSYSYQHSFGANALTTNDDPVLAVVADRSPWCNSAVNRVKRWSEFIPDTTLHSEFYKRGLKGNATVHQGSGQNVLWLDSHVSFERRAFNGKDRDNIYTLQDSDDPNTFSKGRMPIPYDAEASQPRTRRDSVLVQENGRGGP
ncbi:hypothetical protein ACFL6U_13665 [Planctomycetota bacterium]